MPSLAVEKLEQRAQRLQTSQLSVRQAPVRAETLNEDERSIEAVFATDERVQVFDFESMDIIDEILLMRNPGPTIPAKIPFLDDHLAFLGNDAALGSGRDMRIEELDGGRTGMVGRLHFLEGPEDSPEGRAYRLARGGHSTAVSIGYRPTVFKTAEPGEALEVNGERFEAGQRRLRVASQWLPREISHVLFGADEFAQMRSATVGEMVAPTTPQALSPSEVRALNARICGAAERMGVSDETVIGYMGSAAGNVTAAREAIDGNRGIAMEWREPWAAVLGCTVEELTK